METIVIEYKTILSDFISFLLAAVLIYSGGSKIFDRSYFVSVVHDSYGFGIEWSGLIALIIPDWELIVGWFLILKVTRFLGATGALLLSVIFITAMIYLKGGRDCGCFGRNSSGSLFSKFEIKTWLMFSSACYVYYFELSKKLVGRVATK